MECVKPHNHYENFENITSNKWSLLTVEELILVIKLWTTLSVYRWQSTNSENKLNIEFLLRYTNITWLRERHTRIFDSKRPWSVMSPDSKGRGRHNRLSPMKKIVRYCKKTCYICNITLYTIFKKFIKLIIKCILFAHFSILQSMHDVL